MAAPALCRAFTQNAWRRDLCSNCFRSKEEHKAAAAARQKSPTAAARLAGTSAVKSILKGSIKASNGIGKKNRSAVSFHKEESQVIGYGGDDEIHSEDEEAEMEELEPPNEEDLEREKTEQQALERLTKANTDFNSVIANLQLESASIEKPTVGKGAPSGIPVPGGRSTYTGPLRLGLGSKDNDGNKKTLLVSVRPFGSGGEEVSRPPTKTKISVTNGYGSGISVNGSAKESKDAAKSSVGGTLTNGYSYTSVSSSKEISVKLSVSSKGDDVKSTVNSHVSTWKSSAVNGSNLPKTNGNGDGQLFKSKIINGSSKQFDTKLNDTLSSSSKEVNGGQQGCLQNQNGKHVVTSSKIGIPIPANRSNIVKEDTSLEKSSHGMSKENHTNSNGNLTSISYNRKECTKIISSEELKEDIIANTADSCKEIDNKKGEDSCFISGSAIPNAEKDNCINDVTSESEVKENENTPNPSSKEIAASEEKSLEKIKTYDVSAGINSVDDKKETAENLVKTEERKVGEDSKEFLSVDLDAKSSKDMGSDSLNDSKCNISEVTSSQVPPNQLAHKNDKTKNVLIRQDAFQGKTPEEITVAGKKFVKVKPSTTSVSSGAPKIPPVTKRPAPSILKMGVPTGWNPKSASQKHSSPSCKETNTKISNEEKNFNDRANIVNGILKTQSHNTTAVSPDKAIKSVNTIAKLRANFVNNNLKIIAESAAKIVNGTRYGAKNSLADEIPISKSSVMNLSMRPISTNNLQNKPYSNEDYDSNPQGIKGSYMFEKGLNSSSSRARGIGPDIRELLRSPDKEKEEPSFPNPITNAKDSISETKISDEKTDQNSSSEISEDLCENIKEKSVNITEVAKPEKNTESNTNGSDTGQIKDKLSRKEMDLELESCNKNPKSDIQGNCSKNESENQSKENATINTGCHESSIEFLTESKHLICEKRENSSNFYKVSEDSGESDSKLNLEDEIPKKDSPSRIESSPEKSSSTEKSRKKGIVRRILLKSGNEIYRKAGEMVRSVRRSNDSKDESECVKEIEVQKEDKIHVENQTETLDHSSFHTDNASHLQNKTVMTEPEVPVVVCVDEAINTEVSIPTQNCIHKVADIKQEITALQENVSRDSVTEISQDMKVPNTEEVELRKPLNVMPRPVAIAGIHPPIMSPRPSFLHSKINGGQSWALSSPTQNTFNSINECNVQSPSSTPLRSERAVSLSSIGALKGPDMSPGHRSRLTSLPSSDFEFKSSSAANTTPVSQPALRRPGPIITGAKPAVPLKPMKVLEASSLRQTGTLHQQSRMTGERKGSTSVGTPGSVGRSAGKRQAPKPPGMDTPQRRESNSSNESASTFDLKSGTEKNLSAVVDGNQSGGNQPEKQSDKMAEVQNLITPEVQHNACEGKEIESNNQKVDSKTEGEFTEKLTQDQKTSTYGEEIIYDDSASPPRGTHFVKNQALNASKSSSRVARETERRQMLLQMQSNPARGPVPYPEEVSLNPGNSTLPESLLQLSSNSSNLLSARQRSASLGRSVGVTCQRPPLPGGSLGRVAGEGAAISISSDDIEKQATTNVNNEVPDPSETTVNSSDVNSTLPYQPTNYENTEVRLRTDSPIRSRSEGSLSINAMMTPVDDPRVISGASGMETPNAKSQIITVESPMSVSASGKKKRHTVRGFLKFLRRGSLRDDANGTGFENRDEASGESEPKARPIIVHPLELDGACVEVVKGGGVDVRRRLEEENANNVLMSEAMKKMVEGINGMTVNEQSTPQRPTSIPLAPPRPPPVLHSPSSPSLSSSSSSSAGSTPVRPRPPPPPRGLAPVPPSPIGGSGQKPARPPPPKPAHLLRLGLIDKGTPPVAVKSSGDGIYANLVYSESSFSVLGEVRATLTPCKPQRTASMREVIPGKVAGETPGPRITPRNIQSSSSDCETLYSNPLNCTPLSVNTSNSQTDAVTSNSASPPTSNVLSSESILGNSVIKHSETLGASKCDKLSWNIDTPVVPKFETEGALCTDLRSGGADSSSEEESVSAPPLPLVPPPSLPPPLPLNPPPSPPSHPTSSSSSSSLANPLVLPEDSGYESVEFHVVHDTEAAGGRWWSENGIATSRGSVVTTTTDSLEESYEAVVGANHRALADVLAQVCQPNPEEFAAYNQLKWSDFLVEGPKGGILRSVGPVTFHRAAMKGKGAISGGDSWRRVTLGVSQLPMADLPQYFRGCSYHEGGNAPVVRCSPALKPLCIFHDKVPNRFFMIDSGKNAPDSADLVEATIMVFNPLHLYSLNAFLDDLMRDRKTSVRFPPHPDNNNWSNRACLFLLVLLDTICGLEWCGREDCLCIIREEARPGPATTEGDGEISENSHPICPLPRLYILPSVTEPETKAVSSPSSCFQSILTQILEGINEDIATDSFSHALQFVLSIQGSDDALTRSRATLELWLFGPPLIHTITPYASNDRTQDEVCDNRDVSRWSTKNVILSFNDTEPVSVEGELSSAVPRRWLDLERAGALRSLAVSALHKGTRFPSASETGLENSNSDEGMGLVGKCCHGWRVGEVAGNPSLPICEEVRLRFLVGTSGSEVAEAWELLTHVDASSPTSVNVPRTLTEASNKKLASWNYMNEQSRGEAHC